MCLKQKHVGCFFGGFIVDAIVVFSYSFCVLGVPMVLLLKFLMVFSRAFPKVDHRRVMLCDLNKLKNAQRLAGGPECGGGGCEKGD